MNENLPDDIESRVSEILEKPTTQKKYTINPLTNQYTYQLEKTFFQFILRKKQVNQLQKDTKRQWERMTQP
jgi:hypothetical protein